ncbi:MAG: hypothetical protein ABIK44_03355 [candidate division WOR-3 bacterium]
MVSLLLLLTVAAHPVSVTRDLHIVLLPRGVEAVRVTHRFGTVAIVGRESDSLEVEARVKVQGRDRGVVQRFAAGIDVIAEGRAETLVVATRYPEFSGDDTTLSYEVDLAVWVPEGFRVSAQNAFGDIRLRDVRADSRLSGRYGNIELERVGGAAVTGRFGDVSASEVFGSISIDNGFGNVFLRGVRGEVRVRNSYGNVEAERPAGMVNITNSFGRVACRCGPGRTAIVNRCGEVTAAIDDPMLELLDIMTRQGLVRLKVAEGLPFQLESRTRGGRVQSGLPLETAERLGTSLAVGRFGEGGPKVAVQAEMGDIYIGVESLFSRHAPERSQE